MRKRLVIVVAAVVALVGLAPAAEAGSRDPWLCLANRDANIGACFYDPL